VIKCFFTLFYQDLIIASRNALMWVLLGALITIVLIVKLVIPADYEMSEIQYFYDQSSGGYLEAAARLEGHDDEKIIGSMSELEKVVAEEQNAIGIILEEYNQEPRVTIIHHGTISRENRNLIAAAIEKSLKPYYTSGSQPDFQVQYLRPAAEKVPQNQNAIPPLLAFEVIVNGFMMVAVLLFQEKMEGTIKAYRVSPGGTSIYIISKAAVFALVGLLYGLLMVLPTIGFSFSFPALFAVLFFGSLIYTFLGLAVASFFKNISEWLFIGIGMLMINMAPVISYGWPSFAPRWLTYIPSYPIIFGLREILFPTGRPLEQLFILLPAAAVAAYLVCYLAVKNKLMREGN